MSAIYNALVEVSKMRKPERLGLFSRLIPVGKNIACSSLVPAMAKRMLLLFQRIEAALPNKSSKVIQFIGSKQGEGTSTIAREFAKTLAFGINKKVLLLDADRVHPSHHGFFGISYGQGWQDIIRNKWPAEDAIYCYESSDLFVCPSSNTAMSTPELFDARVFDPFLNALRPNSIYS